MQPSARSIIEVALEIYYDEGKIVVGWATILWLETFLQNFISCLRQSVSRLAKLVNSLDHELLGVASEEPIRGQNEEVIVHGDFLPHNFRLGDDKSLVLSVAEGSRHCQLTLNFSTQYGAV